MSVVAVKIYDNEIQIASDSILVYGDTKNTHSNFHKLNKINDKLVVGAVGDAQEASLFMHFCETHSIASPTEKDVLSFMCEFLSWQLNFTETSTIDNEYIIVYDKKAFSIQGLFVEEILDYAAIGAGQDYALAALYLKHSPKEAVKVSCDLCCYVAEPIIEYIIDI